MDNFSEELIKTVVMLAGLTMVVFWYCLLSA